MTNLDILTLIIMASEPIKTICARRMQRAPDDWVPAWWAIDRCEVTLTEQDLEPTCTLISRCGATQMKLPQVLDEVGSLAHTEDRIPVGINSGKVTEEDAGILLLYLRAKAVPGRLNTTGAWSLTGVLS